MLKGIHSYLKICMLLITSAFILSCESSPHAERVIGYIEGEFTYITSNASGTLQLLAVKRGQLIEKGELLYQLDPEPEASSVKASLASISNLKSQVDFYQLQLTRQQNLYRGNATSKMELEKAKSTYDSYVQQLSASQANLIQTKWALDQKRVNAPINGIVFDTYYLLGEKVLAYRPVLSLLNPANIQVIFYIPEDKLSHLKLGQEISFTCDGCASKNQATVFYISPKASYTPPIIYSESMRNQLVYLVRARLTIEIAKNYHPGQPIDIVSL